jgi:hypothetical protein
MPFTKTCGICGKEFTPPRSRQKFCSYACSSRNAKRGSSPERQIIHVAETNTVLIELTKSQFVSVDECDMDLSLHKWKVLTQGRQAYAIRSHFPQGSLRMHRLIMERILGRPLARHEQVDHKDGDGLNNTRSNLRLATAAQNVANSRMPKTNTSGFKGVAWHKRAGKWAARIQVQGKNIHLGLFIDPEEAHRAYITAANQYFGEFANDGTSHTKPVTRSHRHHSEVK